MNFKRLLKRTKIKLMKKKILKWGLKVSVIGIVTGGLIILYLFNMPHRDVINTSADFNTTSTELVNEYLNNYQSANNKYLEEEGDSKIIAVTGNVYKKEKDLKNQWVVLLKESENTAGVSFTFTQETNKQAESLKIGTITTLKGVIRSGANYDEDLELFEDVVIEKSSLLNIN